MEGWVKIYRWILKKPIWQQSTPEQKTVLITLLLMACHEENEWEWRGEQYRCKPGQFVTSLESIVDNCGKGVSIQNVRTALKRFEKYEFLTNESTKHGRLITVVNWEHYQSITSDSNKENNSQLTNDQQTINKRLTPNKNVKNVKNEKKDIKTIVRFTPPDVNAIRDYCMERNNNVDPQSFFDFYESKGWMVGRNKMKDWKAAIRTWEKNNHGQTRQEGTAKRDRISEVDSWH